MQRFTRVLVVFTFVVSCAFAQSDSPDQKKNEANKLYNEGNSLYKAGNYAAAIEKYKGALALAEDFAYHYQAGLCYKSSKQYENAIASMEASIKLRPNFAGSHNALGGIYLMQGNYDRGIESFKQSLRYDANLKSALKGISESYAGKGQQLLDDGKLDAAGTLIDEALQQHSDNAKLYLLAARIYNKLERPEKAIEAANEAMKLKKGKSKGAEYFEIGIAHKKMKEYDDARRAFAEARKDPSYSRHAQYELDGIKGK